MMQFKLLAVLLATTSAGWFSNAKTIYPAVVMPPSLRWNATNTITVTPVVIKNRKEVEAEFRIEDTKGNLYVREDLIWKAGVANNKHFLLRGNAASLALLPSELRLKIDVKGGHTRFVSMIKTSTDLRVVHVFSDKQHYKSGEMVNIRALPLNVHNQLYTQPIELVLVNPGRFELLRRRVASQNGRFVQTKMQLPQHLQDGEWRIEARAIESKETLGTVYFNVHDYILPNFEVAMTVDQETADIKRVPVTVKARYTHTVLVEGSLSLHCVEVQDNQENRSKPILEVEFVRGVWKGTVDLSACGSGGAEADAKPRTVLAVLRDKGGGNVGEASVVHDPKDARFDLIPLRPGLGARAKKISILSAPYGGSKGSQIYVVAKCLDKSRTLDGEPRQLNKIGDTIEIVTPTAWSDANGVSKCAVVVITAHRKLADGSSSRNKTLIIPVISSQNIDLSWIEPIKGSYKVGDRVTTRVDTKGKHTANYLIHCNGRQQIVSGILPGPVAPVSFNVTADMKGVCLLAVYTAQQKLAGDVLLFTVEEACTYSVEALDSGDMRPGMDIDLHLQAGKEGLAVLAAVDDRLSWITDKSLQSWQFLLPSKMWAYQIGTDSASHLTGIIDFTQMSEDIAKTCESAGRTYHSTYKQCPEKWVTTSTLLDVCMKHIIRECEKVLIPQTSNNCAHGKNCLSKTQESDRVSVAGVFEYKVKAAAIPVNDVPLLLEKPAFHVRKHLPHVWIFDDFPISSNGRLRLSYKLPDTVGKWSLMSSFWARGTGDLCAAPEATVSVGKEYFIQAKIPAAAYHNETVAVEITVSGDAIEDDVTLVICQSSDRSVCSDVGLDGERGGPEFYSIALARSNPIATRTFPMRFLSVGEHNVTFTLRKEDYYPGVHHCDGGQVLDAVQHTVLVQKRADTEERYRGLILTVDKPVIDAAAYAPSKTPAVDIIDIREYRQPDHPETLVTEISTPLKATEQIYTFTLEISKFLPLPEVQYTDAQDIGGRSKRSLQPITYTSSFLTDVLQQLSIHVFKQEQLRAVPTTPVGALEALDNAISSSISDMLRFSDCPTASAQHKYCGFSNEAAPKSEQDYSLLLTSISVSLLCKASADPQLTCLALDFLHSRISATSSGKNMSYLLKNDREMEDAMQFKTNTDRLMFSKFLIAQAAHDCRMYACLAKSSEGDRSHDWHNLYRSFYEFNDNNEPDGRVTAALAVVSTGGTRQRMRGQLRMDIQSGDIPPFWSARAQDSEAKGYGRNKPGDILMNALALEAFIDFQTEAPMNFDLLADWIDEQRGADELYGNLMDTHFASRAIAAYKVKRAMLPGADESDVKVEIRCDGCPKMAVNVTDSAPLFYIPTHVRNLTIHTTGRGKARAGVRILSAKKHRQRRGNVNTIGYPVEISVDQRVHNKNRELATTQQTVCIMTSNPRIKYVEVVHGIYTGFTTQPHHFNPVKDQLNASMVPAILDTTPFYSTYAVHFVLSGLEKDKQSCYTIALMEPSTPHDPTQLAPVAITVRHSSKGTIGEAIIAHPDTLANRFKRSLNLIMPDRKQVVVYDYVPRRRNATAGSVTLAAARSRRDVSSKQSLIDAVCFAGGQCTCAERSCRVSCGECGVEEAGFVRQDVCVHGAFAATVEIKSLTKETAGGQEYNLLELEVFHWQSRSLGKPARLFAWLRPCAFGCRAALAAAAATDGSTFMLVGASEAVTADESGRLHYVLRDWDRLAKLDQARPPCSRLLTAIVANKCSN